MQQARLLVFPKKLQTRASHLKWSTKSFEARMVDLFFLFSVFFPCRKYLQSASALDSSKSE